jgi:MPBQ/MSBQ methyltransferase
VRLIQHKREAYWFYSVVSRVYDRWVNPLFWTPAMRERALALARLDDPGLEVLDVGAGTGFTTEGIVARVPAERVTMVDQSPHQLARAKAKPALAAARKVLGDAEALPVATDAYDRVVSAGSIEYWPDPQGGIAELYRALRPGGRAVVVGPVRPRQPVARWLADAWMLFPEEDEYRAWFARAGFADVELVELAPDWYRAEAPYGVAIAGRKPAPGASPAAAGAPREDRGAPLTPAGRVRFALRFAAGSLAGLAFVPLAVVLTLRARLGRRRAGGRS